jgi:hypothetical protein
MTLCGRVARMGEMRYSHKILTKNLKERITLEIVVMWEYNMKMNIREIECDGMDYKHMAQDSGRWQATLSSVGLLHLMDLL